MSIGVRLLHFITPLSDYKEGTLLASVFVFGGYFRARIELTRKRLASPFQLVGFRLLSLPQHCASSSAIEPLAFALVLSSPGQ